MDNHEIISKLDLLIARLDGLPLYNHKTVNSEFDKWYRSVEVAFKKLFVDENKLSEFYGIKFNPRTFIGITELEYRRTHERGRVKAKNLLESIKDEIVEYGIEPKRIATFTEDQIIENILTNFHRCYRQILIRHSKRSTLEINDEYDVQDLLHGILKLHFDDVRVEVSIPQHAGSNSRIDFVLNKHNIAIEVKKTRSNLKDKEIGDELLIDIARYQQAYPKLKLFICFVYDPDGLIRNPVGLENDLNTTPSEIKIKTIICPQF